MAEQEPEQRAEEAGTQRLGGVGDALEGKTAPLPAWPEGRAIPDWAQDVPGRSRPTGGGPPRVGTYLIGPLLGEGGMGTVYLAWDVALGRRVALKLVRGESTDMLRRMIMEARLQARVEHPAVCRIYQIGDDIDRPYIAMQYIQGANLAEWAPHLGLEGKLRLMIQVADAVNAAHRMGLIHRDLKPANLLVEQDEAGVLRPFVMDFGLARDMGGIGITQHGIAVGSPSYMAPEQAAGEKVDERTDVYGLGATLYELFSGRPPFQGASVVDTVRLVMERDAPMLRTLDPGIPPDLESVVHKCLDKDPGRRYPNARELRDDLQRCLDEEPVEARRQNRYRRFWLRMKRNKALSLVVASASVLVIVFAVFAAWTWREAREQAFWAQRFGNQVREMDATLRNAHLFPLHDLRPERADVQLKLDRIQEQMKQLSRASQGPGWFAIGQGYLMLDRPQEARKAFQSAWDGGYRTPDVAMALAEALADLHRREVEAAFMILRENLRRTTLEEIQRNYQGPILEYLGYAKQSGGLTSIQAAVIARIEHRPAEAARLAREAFDRQRWNYEARIEEIEALFQGARDAADREEERLAAPRIDEAERLLGWLKEAARSDPRVYLCDAQAKLLRIRLKIPGRPLEQSLREGLTALDRALKADPSSGEPHLLRAAMFRWMAASQTALPVQAAYWMDRAIEASVHAATDPYSRARARATQGSLLLAKAERLAEAGRDPSAEVAEGCALWQKALDSGLDQASQRLQGALEMVAGQLLLAEHAFQRGKDPMVGLSTARVTLQRLLDAAPGSLDALLDLARVQRRIGDFQARKGEDSEATYLEAKGHLERYLQAYPSNSSAWNNLGTLAKSQAERALRRGGDPQPLLANAAAAFANAGKLRPRVALYALNLHEIRILQGEGAIHHGENPLPWAEEAERALALARKQEGAATLATELAIGSALTERLKGEAALLGGRNAEAPLLAAERAAREATRLNPLRPESWLTLGRTLTLAAQAPPGRSEALREARRAFGRAAKLDPSDPEIPLALGRLDFLEATYWAKARRNPGAALEAAAGNAAKALALNPNCADARALQACVALARVRLAGGSGEAAQGRLLHLAAEHATTALSINPRQPEALKVLARVESLRGQSSAPAASLKGPFDPALEIFLGDEEGFRVFSAVIPRPSGPPRRPR